VEFCPDLAFGFGWQHPVAPPDCDVQLVLRTDVERSADHDLTFPPGLSVRRTDWGFGGASQAKWTLMMSPSALARRVPALRPVLQSAVEASFGRLAAFNVEAAMRIVSRGRCLVTDRLHAAILAALMRIPVVALDSATHKISAAYAAYLHRFPHVLSATSTDEAKQLVLRSLAAPVK
jgi:pyruvyl transferase EpsO